MFAAALSEPVDHSRRQALGCRSLIRGEIRRPRGRASGGGGAITAPAIGLRLSVAALIQRCLTVTFSRN